MSGRADYLELGSWNVVCYECGRKRKAHMLVHNWRGYYVCPEHNEPREAQDFVRSVPDNQTPPWSQPMPTDTFRTACYPNDTTAIPRRAIPGCALPGYISPMYDSAQTLLD